MVRLEETIRELKGTSKRNLAIAQGRSGLRGEVNKPYHVSPTSLFIMFIVNESGWENRGFE